MAENEDRLTATQAAIKRNMRDSALRYAFDRLRLRLTDYLRVYPIVDSDRMPEHDIVWMSEINGDGPDRTILDAMKRTPQIWMSALPDDIVLVHKSFLEKYLGKDVAAVAADVGAAEVVNIGRRMEYEERYP